MRGKQRAPIRRAVVIGTIVGLVGLVVLLALPVAGLATVLLQVTDEGLQPLSPSDVAAIGPQAGPRAAAVAGAAFDPFDAPGTVLARGTNTQAAGTLHLLTYVLDEVALPPGVPIPALGGRTDAGAVLRLSVTGGPFAVRALPPVIWIDDVPLRFAVISPDLDRVSVLVRDRAVLRSGAAISVSYGEAADVRDRLPEPLALAGGPR